MPCTTCMPAGVPISIHPQSNPISNILQAGPLSVLTILLEPLPKKVITSAPYIPCHHSPTRAISSASANQKPVSKCRYPQCSHIKTQSPEDIIKEHTSHLPSPQHKLHSGCTTTLRLISLSRPDKMSLHARHKKSFILGGICNFLKLCHFLGVTGTLA